MKKVLLVHGWGGSDFPHWQSWLASEIAKDYGSVSFLKLSDFEFPVLKNWKEELKKELSDFKPDIVICHSLANTLWFHLCEEIEEVEKLYLIAPPSFNCKIQEIKSFFPIDLPTKTKAKQSILISSTNDPYMTIEEAKELQKSLGIKMIVLENAGHINTESGHGEWAWILEEIRKDIDS